MLVSLITMVSDENAYDFIFRMYCSVKSDPHIASLGCELVMDEARAAHEKLLTTIGLVMGWGPQAFEEKKAEAEVLCADFKEKFATMLDYGRSIKGTFGEEKALEVVSSRNARRVKSALCSKLTTGGVPEGLALHLASYMEKRGMHRFESHVKGGGGGSSGFADEYKDTMSLMYPCCFFGDASASYYHTTLAKALADNSDAASELRVKALAGFENNKKAWNSFSPTSLQLMKRETTGK